MLMEIFTWTRYYVLHPSESSESSGVSFDSGSLKAPLLWDGIVIRSTLLNHPAVVADSFSSRGTSSPVQYSPASFLDLGPSRTSAPELPASDMPLQSTAFHFCARTVSYSSGQLLTEGGKNLVTELWNHLQLGREYFQLYNVRLGCVFKCLALISQMFSTDVCVSSSSLCSVCNCRIASPFGLHLISGGSNLLSYFVLFCNVIQKISRFLRTNHNYWKRHNNYVPWYLLHYWMTGNQHRISFAFLKYLHFLNKALIFVPLILTFSVLST